MKNYYKEASLNKRVHVSVCESTSEMKRST